MYSVGSMRKSTGTVYENREWCILEEEEERMNECMKINIDINKNRKSRRVLSKRNVPQKKQRNNNHNKSE